MHDIAEFVSRHPFLVIAAAMLLVMIVVHEFRLLTRRWREIEPAELVRAVNAGATLLDLRDAGAYRAGHIAGARNLTLAELDGALGAQDRSRTVIVCCATGGTASRAAGQLAAQGFTDVANLRGGLAAWQAENLPLVQGQDKGKHRS